MMGLACKPFFYRLNSIHFANSLLLAWILTPSIDAIGEEGPVRVSLSQLADQETASQAPVDRFAVPLGLSQNRPTQVAPKREVKLGSRDDSRAESYRLENRGVETPAGKKTGRYCEDGMQRAGLPWMPGVFATMGKDPQHSVGYVGGSTPFKGSHSGVLQGECRRESEGTFGYDYTGLVFKRNTWLLWTHGRRDQGGSGRYETDGPRILPEK